MPRLGDVRALLYQVTKPCCTCHPCFPTRLDPVLNSGAARSSSVMNGPAAPLEALWVSQETVEGLAFSLLSPALWAREGLLDDVQTVEKHTMCSLLGRQRKSC